jgi:hypothetical protein
MSWLAIAWLLSCVGLQLLTMEVLPPNHHWLISSQSYVKTDSRPVCHGVQHPPGAKTRFLLLSESCVFVDGVPFCWEEQVRHLQLALSLAIVVILGPRCAGPVIMLWHNRPMRDLIKFRNLEERDCATVVERCRVLPPLPSPCFAPHRVLLGYAVTTGSCNSKEGPHDLLDVTHNNTQCCVLRKSDSSVYNRDNRQYE